MAASHIARASGLTGTPSSVTIAVYSEAAPGSLLATIPNGDIQRVGSTSVYQVDLYATSVAVTLDLPADGSHEVKTYTLVWTDDAPNEVFGTAVVKGYEGKLSIDRMFRRETPVYPSATVPARGITQAIINAGKPSHLKVDFSADPDDFGTPAATYYEIFSYDPQGRVSEKVPSSTPPSP